MSARTARRLALTAAVLAAIAVAAVFGLAGTGTALPAAGSATAP
jgi:hypothetical protein